MGVILYIRALVLSMVLKGQDLLGNLPDVLFLLDPLLNPLDDLLGAVLGDPLPPASHGRVAAAVRISQPSSPLRWGRGRSQELPLDVIRASAAASEWMKFECTGIGQQIKQHGRKSGL